MKGQLYITPHLFAIYVLSNNKEIKVLNRVSPGARIASKLYLSSLGYHRTVNSSGDSPDVLCELQELGYTSHYFSSESRLNTQRIGNLLRGWGGECSTVKFV